MILAIDPGTEESGIVCLRPESADFPIGHHDIMPNDKLWKFLRSSECISREALGFTHAAIETFACYGKPVGRTSLTTIRWAGRFEQVLIQHLRLTPILMERREVKMLICHSASSKDSHIRQALIDLYGPGKATAIGVKAKPGPLYGVNKHEWAALGLAVAVARKHKLMMEG